MVDYCFTFLKDKFPEIEKMTKELEFNLYNQNSMSVLTMGGSIAENIINKVCEYEDVPISDLTTQESRIDYLFDKKVLSSRLTKDFHEIRHLRNMVVHQAYQGDIDEAYTVHHIIYNIIEWFYKKYEDPEYEIPGYSAMLYEDKKYIQQLYDEALAGDKKITPPLLCPTCGFEVSKENRYCPECGERLKNLDINQDVAKKIENFPITEELYSDELEKYQLQKELETKNTRLIDYQRRRDDQIHDLKKKHKRQLDELYAALNNVNLDLTDITKKIKSLENKSFLTQQEKVDLKDANEEKDYLLNERKIINKRKTLLFEKQPCEMQDLIDDLNFERETIDQMNYREQEEILNDIAIEKRRLRRVQRNIENGYKREKFIICPHCGERNTLDTVYCINCGSIIKPNLKPNHKVYCTQCGLLLDSDYDYCTSCGHWMH